MASEPEAEAVPRAEADDLDLAVLPECDLPRTVCFLAKFQ